MLYVSELTGKQYKSENECKEGDKKFLEEQKAKEEAKKASDSKLQEIKEQYEKLYSLVREVEKETGKRVKFSMSVNDKGKSEVEVSLSDFYNFNDFWRYWLF